MTATISVRALASQRRVAARLSGPNAYRSWYADSFTLSPPPVCFVGACGRFA